LEPEPGPDPAALAYVDRVRQLTKRLSARQVAPDDVAAALDAVRDVATLDADAPTASNRPEARLIKVGVKRLVAWYMVYLAEEVNDLAFALLRLGEALATRAERSEATSLGLLARLDQLEDRVRRLEGTRADAQGKDAGHEA
jgi:hypothetical protein